MNMVLNSGAGGGGQHQRPIHQNHHQNSTGANQSLALAPGAPQRSPFAIQQLLGLPSTTNANSSNSSTPPTRTSPGSNSLSVNNLVNHNNNSAANFGAPAGSYFPRGAPPGLLAPPHHHHHHHHAHQHFPPTSESAARLAYFNTALMGLQGGPSGAPPPGCIGSGAPSVSAASMSSMFHSFAAASDSTASPRPDPGCPGKVIHTYRNYISSLSPP